MEKIRQAIRKIALEGVMQFSLLTGKVASVDATHYTCDVLPADGSPMLYDVRLRGIVDNEEDGFIVLPDEGADVVVGMLDSSNGVMLQCSKVSKIIAFGGKRGGMLYSDKVLPLLEDINARLTAIENILKGSPIPEAGNGAPSALQSALKIALQTPIKQPLNGFTNDKFLQ